MSAPVQVFGRECGVVDVYQRAAHYVWVVKLKGGTHASKTNESHIPAE